MNTILIRDDKSMVQTVSRPIIKGENRADEIQFLFSQDFYKNYDPEKVVIMLQAILPYADEEAKTVTTGKLRYMDVDEKLYKNMHRMELPITTVLTKEAGDVILWFLFFDTTNPQNVIVQKTAPINVEIEDSLKGSSAILVDDDSYDVLARLESDIKDLKENKLDKKFDYDEENRTIQFYSNGEKLGDPVKLDNEVAWKGWDE